MTLRFFSAVLSALWGAQTAALAQSLVEVVPDLDKTFTPMPVESVWISEQDLTRLTALTCVESAGAYRVELLSILDETGTPKPVMQRRIEPGAIKALGWVLAPASDESASVWISQAALDYLGIKSRDFPLTLNSRLSVMPIGGGPSTMDQKVLVSGAVAVGPQAAPLRSVLMLKPGKVLRSAHEKLTGNTQVSESVPPNVVLRTKGTASACLGQITGVVNGWGPKPGVMKYKILVR